MIRTQGFFSVTEKEPFKGLFVPKSAIKFFNRYSTFRLNLEVAVVIKKNSQIMVATFSDASEVLTLFLIPIGGGIPAGVILAKNRSIEWPMMLLLYFVSDLILACVFEPLMLWFIKAARTSPFLTRFMENYKQSLAKMGMKTDVGPRPLSLIALSFGVDPMTGRAVAKAAGHGFVLGWTYAICGDMFFFVLIMASTLWLNNVLGDGTMAAVIVMVAMIAVPMLIRRVRGRNKIK